MGRLGPTEGPGPSSPPREPRVSWGPPRLPRTPSDRSRRRSPAGWTRASPPGLHPRGPSRAAAGTLGFSRDLAEIIDPGDNGLFFFAKKFGARPGTLFSHIEGRWKGGPAVGAPASSGPFIFPQDQERLIQCHNKETERFPRQRAPRWEQVIVGISRRDLPGNVSSPGPLSGNDNSPWTGPLRAAGSVQEGPHRRPFNEGRQTRKGGPHWHGTARGRGARGGLGHGEFHDGRSVSPGPP